jgi:hypothetical protein
MTNFQLVKNFGIGIGNGGVKYDRRLLLPLRGIAMTNTYLRL